MIHNRLIVCIASSWDYDPTSKHHLMKILSRHNDVLWINYHGSRRPEVNTSDLKDIYTALRHVARGLRRVTPSIVQLTPMVIPGATNPFLEKVHQRMVIAQIRRAIDILTRGQPKPIQLWSFAPDVPYLVGALQEECSLYYCVDEYRQFDGFNVERITTAENELIDRADVVVATSGPLLQAKRARRSDCVLIRHGVDFDHFSTAWRKPGAVPSDLADLPRPLLGYFGLIHHWVDVAFLAEIARLRPSYSFVLIGECKCDLRELENRPNIYRLGRRPYESLPAYASAFDAGLLLFAQRPMTRHVNPVKMVEYLAAGLPVLSTPLPEAERFAGAITICPTPELFAQSCDHVVNSPRRDREEISRIVRNETWLSKVEYISELVMSRTHPPVMKTASKPIAEVGIEPAPGKSRNKEALGVQ